MKYIAVLLALLLLITGCGQTPPETNTEETAQPPVETTEATQPPVTEAPDPLEDLLAIMPTEYKVGQLFLARCPEENAAEDVKTYHLGGFVLFGRDFEGQTKQTLTETLSQYQLASAIPLLIAVDEEGGTVCRVSGNAAFRAERFSSPRTLYAAGGMTAVLGAEQEKAELLSSLGINVNLAPVCDITTDPGAFLYSRSLGQSPEITEEFAAGAVRIMAGQGVGAVLKHFPGYGNNADTHTGLAVDDRTLEELEGCDLIPFQAGIDAGCGAVMVSHTIVNALDPELPASLSPAVHAYLREEMGFTGVIATDDLAMGAISDTYGPGEAAVLAVLAGNDLLCSTEYAIEYEAVLEAVGSGRIPMELLDDAVLRVLRWKQQTGLLY